MGVKIVIVFVLVVCTLFGGLVAPALGERCFAARAGGVQAEAISDGARFVGYRILDAEAGVVCFAVGSSLTCLDTKQMFPYYLAFEVDGRLVPSGPYSEQELRVVAGEADARIDLVYDGDYELFIDGDIGKAIVLVDKDSGRMSLIPDDGSLEIELLAAQAEGKLVFEVNGGHGVQVVPCLPGSGDTVYVTLGWWDNYTGKPRAAVWDKCAFAGWDACRLAAVLFMSGASYGLRMVRTFRSDPLVRMRQAVLAKQKENKRRNESGFIDDGWSQYPKHCTDCGAAVQIVRPGDARCPNGCWQRQAVEDVTVYLVLPISEDENLTIYQVVGVVEEAGSEEQRRQ